MGFLTSAEHLCGHLLLHRRHPVERLESKLIMTRLKIAFVCELGGPLLVGSGRKDNPVVERFVHFKFEQTRQLFISGRLHTVCQVRLGNFCPTI